MVTEAMRAHFGMWDHAHSRFSILISESIE